MTMSQQAKQRERVIRRTTTIEEEVVVPQATPTRDAGGRGVRRGARSEDEFEDDDCDDEA
jgi:hypothetical protein